jgi:hypothetical protein
LSRTGTGACHKLTHFKVGRVVAKLMHSLSAAVGNKAGKEAEEQCASGQHATAAVALKLLQVATTSMDISV